MGSTEDEVAVGFVGLGTIARTHLAVLAGIPRVRLAFVADPDPGAVVPGPGPGSGSGAEPPPRYDGLDAALADHRPDLVVLATPTPTHAALARVALTGSDARVLVEKPLVHTLAALDALRSLGAGRGLDLDGRVFVAHHFAFSPEVLWAADQLATHPEWGPVTRITVVFHDAYIVDVDHSFAAYGSSWIDSGINQLSMLARFVELTGRGPLHETAGGASSWCTIAFRSGGSTGTGLLRASWEAAASSKRTVLHLEESGTELWLDNTAVTALALRDGAIVDHLANDGRTPRKIAHYQPLYASLLSPIPDPLLSLPTATHLLRLLHTPP